MNGDAKWLMFGLLGLQAMFLGTTFATWRICLFLFGVFAVLAWLHRRRLRQGTDDPRFSPSTRWIGNTLLYLCTALLISVWRFGDYAGESINPIAFAFDAVAHTALLSAFLLWAIHPVAGHPAMLGLGLLVVLLCVAAGGASHSMASQLAVALATTIGFVFGSGVILAHHHRAAEDGAGRGQLATSHGDMSSGPRHADSGRLGLLFSLLVLSAILMTTTAIAHVTGYMLPDIQSSLHNRLSNTLEAVQDQSLMGDSRYVRGSHIGSIRRHMLGNPASVALRAYATSSPGYLRGTVFDTYADGRWWAISNDRLSIEDETRSIQTRDLLPSGQALTRLQGDASRTLRRFFLFAPDDERIASIEIHNDPLKGAVIFTPLATRWVEASSRAITVSHHNIIQAGVNISNPYVCGVAKTTKAEIILPEREGLLLQLPLELRDELETLAGSLCAGRGTATSKAAAISQYFQQNFQYSHTQDPPRTSGDPIIQFLSIKHPAHCEYFATATVLLLRAAGVPARYVTGYVASEYSDEESYWLARNRDAHAWVEAYDQVSGHWFAVESTPGRTYESLSLAGADADQFAASNTSQSDNGNAGESLFSRVWGWITSMRATDPISAIFRFGQLPLFCVLVFLLWKSFHRGYDAGLDPDDIKSRQMLQRIDRKLKKLSLVRQPHETLHQFAARIENSLDADLVDRQRHGEFLDQAANWYRQYAAARYRGQLPTPFGYASAT